MGGRVELGEGNHMSRMEDQKKKEDLESQLEAATKEQGNKLTQSKEHLLGQLRMASEKYLTVNGYMQVRSTIEQAAFGDQEGADDRAAEARMIAREMSELAGLLAEQLEKVDVMSLDDSFLDGHLDSNFVAVDQSVREVTRQLLVVNLLQNVGPAIDEIVNFRNGTTEGIAKLSEELAKLGHIKGQLKMHEGGQAAN